MTVPERMLSLAIGREGQNARLAARLTGWRIDIRSDVSVAEAKAAADAARAASAAETPAEAPRRGRGAATDGAAKPKRADAEAAASRGRREAAAAPKPADGAEPAKPKRVTKKAAGARPKAAAAAGRRSAPRRPTPSATAEADRAPRPTPAAKPKRAIEEDRAPSHPGRWRRRPGGRGPSPRGASRTGPASPAGRSVRSASCMRDRADAGRRRRSSTRPGRLAGRGAYVCRTGDCLDKAIDQGRPQPGARRPRSRPSCATRWPGASPIRTRSSKEEPVARSRSGTRGRRGPRKPPRRDGAFAGSGVQTLDPRERGAIELPGTITVKELAELLGVNPADIIRELIKSGIFATINQLIDRDTASLVAGELGYEVAETEARRRRRRRRGRRRPGRRGDQGGPLRGGRPVAPPAARPDRDRHGPRRPRQDEPARRDPDDRGRGRRARRDHPAHRRERGHPRRQARRLPRHAGSRGVHRDARPRRARSPTSRSSSSRPTTGSCPRRSRRSATPRRPRSRSSSRSTRSTSPTPTRTGSRPS